MSNGNKMHSNYSSSQAKYPIQFNQQSTQQLIHELKVSLRDVEEIIQKSKQSIDLIPNDNNRTPIQMPIQCSSINFNISNNQDQIPSKCQLTYSNSPQNDKKQKNLQLNNNRSEKNILKRILFQDFSHTTHKQNNKQSRIPSKSKSKSHIQQHIKNTKIQIQVVRQLKYQETKSVQIQTIQQVKQIQMELCNSDEPDQQKQFRYEEQYCIIINKGNKKKKKQSKQLLYSQSTNKFTQINYLQRQLTKNSSVTDQNSITHKKFDSDQDQNEIQNQKNIQQFHNDFQNQYKQRNHQISNYKENDKDPVIQNVTNQAKIQQIKTHPKANSNMIDYRKTYRSKSPKVEQFMLDQSLINTCAKNELQNILELNSKSKKKNKQKIENNNNQLLDHQKIKMQKQVIRLSGKKSEHRVRCVSPLNKKKFQLDVNAVKINHSKPSKPKQLIKSPAKQQKITKRCYAQSPISSSKKPNYIQKYINVLSYNKKKNQNTNSRKNQTQKTQQQQPIDYLNKYSHPSKSPEKKKNTVLEIQQITNKQDTLINKQIFIKQMKEQCYVRRFLNENELYRIYNQFQKRKVPRYQWEEKVIQKIFNKIHQTDDII